LHEFSGPLGLKWGVREGAKMRKGWYDVDPTNLLLLLGVLMSVPILVKIKKKCAQMATQIN